MAIVATFGPKTFEINDKLINTFSDFNTKLKLATDKQTDDGGKPSTNTKGADLETITLKIQLADRLGVQTRAEYKDWRAILEKGDAYPFIIGGEQWGAAQFQLQEISLSDTHLGRDGLLDAATLSLNFTEWQAEAAKEKKSSANKKSKTKSSSKSSRSSSSGSSSSSSSKTAVDSSVTPYDPHAPYVSPSTSPSRLRQDDWSGITPLTTSSGPSRLRQDDW